MATPRKAALLEKDRWYCPGVTVDAILYKRGIEDRPSPVISCPKTSIFKEVALVDRRAPMVDTNASAMAMQVVPRMLDIRATNGERSPCIRRGT
jgi:hypothetical protein